CPGSAEPSEPLGHRRGGSSSQVHDPAVGAPCPHPPGVNGLTRRRGMFYIPLVSAQAPSAVILVRALKFMPNPATAADNAFQRHVPMDQPDDTTSGQALAEMDALAATLRGAGGRVRGLEAWARTRAD